MSWIYSPKQTLKVSSIRWMIRRDMPEVLDIERQSFEFAWNEEDFLCCLRQRNCIGMVAEHNHRILGFMIYQLHKGKLHILNFAVDPEFRRQDIGTQLIARLVEKLHQQRRQEIALELRESNLAAQLFFKQMGFKAVLVLRSHYNDTNEDCYVMRFCINQGHEEMSCLAWAPKNRIAEYYAA